MLHCVLCRTYLSREAHLASSIGSLMKRWWSLEKQVKEKVVERLKQEKEKTDDATLIKAGFKAGDLVGYGMHRYVYFMCCRCDNPFWGGKHECMVDANDGQDEDDKLCPNCSLGALPMGATICTNPTAHQEYMIWKCRFCCR